MKHVTKLNEKKPFDIDKFEDATNKCFPYYQNGRKYALCPACGSSVQIIGGNNNGVKSIQKSLYAAHTKDAVSGLPFNEESKLNCINYEGNEGNWQKIYEVRRNVAENQELLEFIEDNIDDIAKEVEEIVGFKCQYSDNRSSSLFKNLYKSFKDNDGLRIEYSQFNPEYISRLLILRAGPIECWGGIPLDKVKKKILKSESLKDSMEGNQFKPRGRIKLVGILDDDLKPTRINVRLVCGDQELDIHHVNARVS